MNVLQPSMKRKNVQVRVRQEVFSDPRPICVQNKQTLMLNRKDFSGKSWKAQSTIMEKTEDV